MSDSIVYFFQLLLQNFNFTENSILTATQCSDLLKISKFLEIRKLTFKITEYIKRKSSFDVDFIIQMIDYEMKENANDQQIEIKNDIENLLSIKIDECFSNKKFADLPIEIIFRVINKCSPNQINNNKLFDLIKKSISKFCVLLQFLDLQQLSDDRIEELCDLYSKSEKKYFDYSGCNINYIKEQQNKMKELQIQISKLMNQLTNSENEMNDIKKQLKIACQINGQIVASVKNGLLIRAQINLTAIGKSIDFIRSKYIISLSNAETIGKEAYEKGEPITTFQTNTDHFHVL